MPPNKAPKTSELKTAMSACRRTFFFAGLFSLFINLLMLVPPLYMLQLYDRVLTSRSYDTLLMLTLIVIFLFFIMALLEIIRSKLLVIISNRLDLNLSERVFEGMFTMANAKPGFASSQPSSDFNQVRQYLTGQGVFAFFDAPWLPIYIGILFIFHPVFGYFALAAAIILFILALLNEFMTRSSLSKSSELQRQEQQFLQKSLQNAEVIHAMGMLDNIKALWNGRHQEFLSLLASSSDSAGIWANISKTSRMMFQSLMLGVGAYLAVNMEVSPGMMIAGSIIMGRALAPLDILINSWKQFKGAKQAYARLGTFLQEFPTSSEPMPLPEPKGELQLENIVVVPPSASQPSISGVSLHIKVGEVIGIIGASAAGKSSLVRAMLGIWPLYAGKARIDKADISQWDRILLGKHLGYLPQDIELFEGTISQNIARFEEVDPSSVVKAAQMAGVHEMILQLPAGYDTVIGPGGIALSGGQRQRVGLARAMYGDPKVLVLDEPNSNLDEQGELALIEAIKTLKAQKKTVILVTHRPTILQVVDKIALLQRGKLVQYASKEEVLSAIASVHKKLKPKIPPLSTLAGGQTHE